MSLEALPFLAAPDIDFYCEMSDLSVSSVLECSDEKFRAMLDPAFAESKRTSLRHSFIKVGITLPLSISVHSKSGRLQWYDPSSTPEKLYPCVRDLIPFRSLRAPYFKTRLLSCLRTTPSSIRQLYGRFPLSFFGNEKGRGCSV